ncbi:membrane-bound alkaline phosphatase-like [Hyposmocoma kahamanoa]|uniref:membrane-bound alkaline phosphatase-like n=1 Tax=Hyposmocoma kahamanoa TaxID=1477025 RepID=UPI000E6D96A0|nr:membrane-bound alkaline phosphatase-like [Hyposmocoma kahamanoa]
MRTVWCAIVVLVVAVAIGADHYHPDVKFNPKPTDNNATEQNPDYWRNEAKEGIEKRLRRLQNKNIARNVIMFLGDGLSVPTLAAARILKGQRANHTGEETEMFFETFPTVGLSKTYCLDAQIADSACTATAYLTGVKNNYGAIGVTGAVKRYDCEASTDPSTHLDSIAAWALAEGKDAGIVTTTRITHASPSGAYARVANRGWENDGAVIDRGFDPKMCPDIAHQLIHTDPGKQFKVILGGGRREFLPQNFTDEEGFNGLRRDNRNLIEEWAADKAAKNVNHRYVWDRSQLMNLRDNPPEYILGLFESSHMQYHMERNRQTEPTLAELTEVAINSLKRNEKGFFLFVESGRIDHAHHDNYVQLSLDETLEFDIAIKKAVEMLGEEDTLMVVTADHSHVMAFNGYSVRGHDILGAAEEYGHDDIPFQTISYTNGPGYRKPVNNTRVDVTTEENYKDLRWMTHAEVYRDIETHGGDDVAVFATGPYHHMFTGLYEQSQIPMIMAYAACIGPGLHACNSAVLNHLLSLPIYIIAFFVLLRGFQH